MLVFRSWDPLTHFELSAFEALGVSGDALDNLKMYWYI
jgi:hypothetical protein